MVNKGDVIGLSGATGLVTGPHLHWEMAIDGILLDALRFTDGSNGF
jgi:murein DD-endopeptidase MepM/ murein hydrolase activator NlpD